MCDAYPRRPPQPTLVRHFSTPDHRTASIAVAIADGGGMARLTIIRGGSADPSGRRGRSFQDAADQGTLVRLTPGRFVDASEWRRATPGERHIARIKAVHDRIAPRLVVAYASAAALHGLPWRGEFPDVVEVIDPARSTTQSLTHVRKRPGRGRRLRTQQMITIPRKVTDVTITVADLAISYDLRLSVPALDAALAAGSVLADVRSEVELRGAVHGRHRAEVALALADGRSGSPGESVARVALDEVGAPRPVLQRAFHDAAGFIGRVDFWFPDQGVVLEFDGRTKYVDPALRRPGTSAADVVVTEKRREDRLRRHHEVRGLGRFGWEEANDLDALRAVLRGVGVPFSTRSFMHVR